MEDIEEDHYSCAYLESLYSHLCTFDDVVFSGRLSNASSSLEKRQHSGVKVDQVLQSWDQKCGTV